MSSAEMPRDNRCTVDWPHAPLHRFSPSGIFFVTGATYLKQHYYRTRGALNSLQDRLFALAEELRVWLQAWSILSNHYHLGRKVWFQFRDTELTYVDGPA